MGFAPLSGISEACFCLEYKNKNFDENKNIKYTKIIIKTHANRNLIKI